MKTKLFVLLLTGALLLNLTACSGGSAAGTSPAGTETAPAASGTAETTETAEAEEPEEVEEEFEYSPVIPDAVLNLSEEDDILLNGELKDNVYINQYFGLKLTAPDGMTLIRFNDDATDSSEIIPLKSSYEDGFGGLVFSTELGGPESIMVTICAIDDEKLGLSEEEFVQAQVQETNDLVAYFGVDGGSEYGTAVVAGEEHPVQMSKSEPGVVDYYFHILKGDFEYQIFASAPDEERIEYLISFFEKL